MLTFKQGKSAIGIRSWRVFAGARILGTVMEAGPGPDGFSWHGVTPDGTRFAASSRPKLAQMLLDHSGAARRQAAE